MTLHGNGNGNGNGHAGPTDLAARVALRLLRAPSVALMRRYADWAEHRSRVEITGEGASYAGSAIYVCRAEDLPIVFLHRAHYDDRILLPTNAALDPLAFFAAAAGLVVARGNALTPEVERAVRAGNGALLPIGTGPHFSRMAEIAADLALRTGASVGLIRAQSDRAVRVATLGEALAWPTAGGTIQIDYGPLRRREGERSALIAELRDLVRS